MLLFLAALISASFLPAFVKAHGAMMSPITRNMQSYYAPPPGVSINYDPNWLAAGGVGVTGGAGKAWPSGPHGVCGDPYAGE